MKFKLIVTFAIGMLLVTNASASWVIVNSDGSTQVLDTCCPKKPVKKVVKEPEFCETCDYSKFKDAQLLPVGNEKLQPASLQNCGK